MDTIRGPANKLHDAALIGSTARVAALLSGGSVDIDQADPDGWTPLMLAVCNGHIQVARMLLNKGASVSVVADEGRTALLVSAQEGHLTLTKMLVKAGADLEAETSMGSTPLHLAVESGHTEVMDALIEAGANVDSCRPSGASLLYTAAERGRLAVIKVLLRANANALLFTTDPGTGANYVPLDVAAQCGHSDVVRELVQQLGIEGCGGASGGVNALRLAARGQYMGIMDLLTGAGVVDTGIALIDAAECGQQVAVKFLLLLHQQRHQQKRKASTSGRAYVNATDPGCGSTALTMCIAFCRKHSPRVARLLVDAGADTTSAVQITARGGPVAFNDTPLALLQHNLGEKQIQGQPATKKQLRRLDAIRRLLLQTDAVHAVSWGWGRANPVVPQTAEGADKSAQNSVCKTKTSTALMTTRRKHVRTIAAAC